MLVKYIYNNGFSRFIVIRHNHHPIKNYIGDNLSVCAIILLSFRFSL